MREPFSRVVCAWCGRVAWPPSATCDKRVWIEATDHANWGGAAGDLISHAICDRCEGTLTGPSVGSV
jgi:hypothetical protein